MSTIRHRRTNDGSPQVFRAVRTSERDREDRRKDDRMNDDQPANSGIPTTASSHKGDSLSSPIQSRTTLATASKSPASRSVPNLSTHMNQKGCSRATFCMILSRLTIGLLIVFALSPPFFYRSFVNLEIPQPRVFEKDSTQCQQVAVTDLDGTTLLRTKAPLIPTYSEQWLAMFNEEVHSIKNFYRYDILHSSSEMPFFGSTRADGGLELGHEVESAALEEFLSVVLSTMSTLLTISSKFRSSNATHFHLFTVGDLRKAMRILPSSHPDQSSLNRSIQAFEWLSLRLRNSTTAIQDIRDLNEYVRMDVWDKAKAAIPFCFLTTTAPAYKRIFNVYRCSYSYVSGWNEGKVVLNHNLRRIEFDNFFCYRTWWNDVILQWLDYQASTLTEVGKRGSDKGIWDLLLSRQPGM